MRLWDDINTIPIYATGHFCEVTPTSGEHKDEGRRHSAAAFQMSAKALMCEEKCLSYHSSCKYTKIHGSLIVVSICPFSLGQFPFDKLVSVYLLAYMDLYMQIVINTDSDNVQQQ